MKEIYTPASENNWNDTVSKALYPKKKEDYKVKAMKKKEPDSIHPLANQQSN